MHDAQGRKNPHTYAQAMFRHAGAAEMTSVHNQLTIAWNNLTLDFRRDIPEPTSNTTIAQFLDQLNS